MIGINLSKEQVTLIVKSWFVGFFMGLIVAGMVLI
jgi:hypothetical protein